MTHIFTRTPTGMLGARYFFPKPIVWVEGPTDIYFYEPILGDLGCIVRAFNGSLNARALVEGLLAGAGDYPYAVILDGDYDVLRRQKSVHRWVVVLRRYSFENYLWEKEPLNRSCLRHARVGEGDDIVGDDFDKVNLHMEDSLRELVELDVAARRSDPAPDVLPDRIEPLLEREDGVTVCAKKVAARAANAKAKIAAKIVSDARDDVSRYLESGNFSDIVNGHVLLGILRRVFMGAATRARGSKSTLSDDALTQLLSEMVWRTVPSKEHERLKRKLRSVVRELKREATAVRS